MRKGWLIPFMVKLPEGWELWEDEDTLYLYDPEDREYCFGLHTSIRFLEEFAKTEFKKRRL